MSNNNSSEDEDMGVIRCICDYEHDDGFTIQCDKCYVWQHAICVGIENSNVPENYLCEICNPRELDFESAKQIQKKNFEENAFKGPKRKNSGTRRNARNRNESAPAAKKRQYNCRKASRQDDCTKSISQFNLDEGLVVDSPRVKDYIDELFEKWSKRNEVNNGNVLDYEESIFEIQSCPLDVHQSLPSKTQVRKLDSELIKSGHQKGVFATTQFKKGSLISECKGVVCLKDEYGEDLNNYYKCLCFPLPFVFFHKSQNLVVDCRKQGNNSRFVRMSCNPNAVLRSYFVSESKSDTLHLGIFALSEIAQEEEITILWDIDSSKFSHNLFSNKHYKTPQFQNSVKSIIKNISKDFSEEHLHSNISLHLENINSWIRYIKKCSCNKGLDCRYNRFFKISKKIWKDKSSQIPKNSYDNSSLSNSLLDDSVYDETTPQSKFVELEENIPPASLCLFPISLFQHANNEFDRKAKVPIYLRKQGLKKYFLHKYRKVGTRSSVFDETSIKQEELCIAVSHIKNDNETLIDPDLTESPTQKPDAREMDKIQKMDFIKKLNNLKSNLSLTECSTDLKINTNRPKSKSLSDHSYDLSTQKNKITLLEYLAKINANSNSDKSTQKIGSLPEITTKKILQERDFSDTYPNQSKEQTGTQNEPKNTIIQHNGLTETSVPSLASEIHGHYAPNGHYPLEPKQEPKKIEFEPINNSASENVIYRNEFANTRVNDSLVEIEDKLDFGEIEAESINTYDKSLHEYTDRNSEKDTDSVRGSEKENSKDLLNQRHSSYKRSHSPHLRKEKTGTYSDYYDRDDYHYKRNHHSSSNIRHHSDYKHEQPQYNRDYYNPKYYYDDRERNESRYKIHHNTEYNNHKSYDKYSYSKPFRGYYPDRKVESRYGYLSHPNRDKAIRKSSYDKKVDSNSKNTKPLTESHKEGKMLSSPLSNSENSNHLKRDTNSEISGYSTHKNGKETSYNQYSKNTRYEDYKPSLKQQRGSEYLKNTPYQ